MNSQEITKLSKQFSPEIVLNVNRILLTATLRILEKRKSTKSVIIHEEKREVARDLKIGAQYLLPLQ